MQNSLTESQAFLHYFWIKNILYSDMHYIIFYPEINQKFPSKIISFHAKYFKFKKEKWNTNPK